MIKHLAEKWLREEDLTAPVPGRNDPAGMIAECVKYLRARTRVRATDLVGLDDKARNAIVHARVLTAAVNPRILELEQQVRQQEATITRLLAFVPARVAAVPEVRLQEILTQIEELASVHFAGQHITTTVVEEDDPETDACHHVQLTVYLSEEVPVADLVRSEVELRSALVDLMSSDEIRAMNLLIDFRD